MTQPNYIGPNGLVTQSFEDILYDETDGLITRFLQIFPNANLNQNTPDGQWLNIMALEKKDGLNTLTQYYNNLDVDRAIGIPQQILYKLNGLTIKAYTYSFVYVDVTVTAPVNLQGLDDNLYDAEGVGYTVTDTNGNRWILAESQSLAVGTHSLNFRAGELGNVISLPNTITIMETVIAGVSSVNNPANNYITGGVGESDSEFRTRRNRSMAVPSQGFDDSIQSQLLALDGVSEARVFQNRGNTTDADGIPAHTVWVVVKGGKPQEIAQTIYANMPPGIPMKGTESESVTKPNGNTETIHYDKPTAVSLYINANIKLTGGAIDEDYVKTQLSALSFEIGQSVESANITTEIKNIVGENGAPYNVELSNDGVTFEEIVNPGRLDGYFAVQKSNITLTVVP